MSHRNRLFSRLSSYATVASDDIPESSPQPTTSPRRAICVGTVSVTLILFWGRAVLESGTATQEAKLLAMPSLPHRPPPSTPPFLPPPLVPPALPPSSPPRPPYPPHPPHPLMPPAPPVASLTCMRSRVDFASVAFVGGALSITNGESIDSSQFDVDRLFDEVSGGSGYGCSNAGNPGALSLSLSGAFGNDPSFIFVKDLAARPRNLIGFRGGVGPTPGTIVQECDGGAVDDERLTDEDKASKVHVLHCPTSDANPHITIERLTSPSYLCLAELWACRNQPPSTPPMPPGIPSPPKPPPLPPFSPQKPSPPPSPALPPFPSPEYPPGTVITPIPKRIDGPFCAWHWGVGCGACETRMEKIPAGLKMLNGRCGGGREEVGWDQPSGEGEAEVFLGCVLEVFLGCVLEVFLGCVLEVFLECVLVQACVFVAQAGTRNLSETLGMHVRTCVALHCGMASHMQISWQAEATSPISARGEDGRVVRGVRDARAGYGASYIYYAYYAYYAYYTSLHSLHSLHTCYTYYTYYTSYPHHTHYVCYTYCAYYTCCTC